MKWTFTGEKKVVRGKKLRRVQYADGVVGGWIQHEHNLSQEGACRILDNAQVTGASGVSGDAVVCGDTIICDRRKRRASLKYA